jgi:serine/threonine protein kinase
METLKQLIPKINEIKTNFDGTTESYDNITLLNMYKIVESKLGELCLKYEITNFELPKISGYNSLVLYANNSKSKFAIKIFIISKKDLEKFDTIYKLISDNNISPKIYSDYNIEYNSTKNIAKIIVSERVILFSDFEWETIKQVKNSISSIIEKTLKLHSLGYVHNDIKYENLGLDIDGNVYLFDFDNFSEINRTSCSKLLSSTVCYPPDILVDASIEIGMGNQIIDLFSICAIILGNIIGLNFWAFDNKQLREKNIQVTNFKRNRNHNAIQRKIQCKYKDLCLSQFWFSLVNFFHLVFQKNRQIINKRAFIRRAKKLVYRMKMDYEITGKTLEFTSNFSKEIPNKFFKFMKKNKIEEIIFGEKYNVITDIPNFVKKITFGKNFNSNVDFLPEGIQEIEFGIRFNQPIEKLPKSLLVLRLGPDFDQSVDNLPEKIEKLYFSHSCLAKFNRPMDNLPKNLKVLRTAFLFDHNIEKFPDSIEELKLNYKFAQKIHKFPRNLKDFSCSGYYIYRHELPDY